MTLIVYILLSLSILFPVYTYALYPFVLRLFKTRSRKALDCYLPTVSVLIVGSNRDLCKMKEQNVMESEYKNITEIITVQNQAKATKILHNIKSDVILITDEGSIFLKDSISKLISTMSGEQVGCVCGIVRKKPNENGEFCDSASWKYENKIKELESNIGCLSGANTSIFAYKRDIVPNIFDSKVHLDFYLPTVITEKGYDALFEPKAISYELSERSETDIFRKHIADGVSGYRAVLKFWRLLISFKKGSFVFWSHRVMKWLVPFNMIILFIGCLILSPHSIEALICIVFQILFYIYVAVYYLYFTTKGKELPGLIGAISRFASYFVVLNVSWFIGFLKAFMK